MKNTWKKIALVLVAFVLLSVSVFAGGDQPNLPAENVQQETVVQPRGVPCVYCENGTMVQTDVTTAPWSIVAYIPCECEGGLPYMKDKQMERTVTIIMTCGSCGMGDYDTSIQTKTEHVG